MYIALQELDARIQEAGLFGKRVLVLTSGREAVERFLEYQVGPVVDCMQLLNEVYLKKVRQLGPNHPHQQRDPNFEWLGLGCVDTAFGDQGIN